MFWIGVICAFTAGYLSGDVTNDRSTNLKVLGILCLGSFGSALIVAAALLP